MEGKVYPGCISETVMCKILILGKGVVGVGVQHHGVTLI